MRPLGWRISVGEVPKVFVIFLAAFLYAIGFVGDFAVPRTVDHGVDASIGEAVVVNLVILLVGYRAITTLPVGWEASTTLKVAVLNPIPSASVSTMMTAPTSAAARPTLATRCAASSPRCRRRRARWRSRGSRGGSLRVPDRRGGRGGRALFCEFK